MTNDNLTLAGSTRRADLDWLRVAAFGLLILYHVGMAFVTWDWHVKTSHPGHTIEPAMILTNPWRLGLLFLVSGCATRFMGARLSPGALAWRRLGRLGLPLLFGMAVIVPPQSWVQVREHGFHIGYWAFYAKYLSFYQGYCDAHGCLILPTWNHLWFVAYLLAYTLILAAALAAGAAIGRFGVATLPAIRPGPRTTAALLWLAPAAWLVLLRNTLGRHYPETHQFYGDWYAHAVYFSLFLFGYAAASFAPFWASAVRLRWYALAAGALCYAILGGLEVAYPGDTPLPDGLHHFYRIVFGIDQWMWIFALLGLAHRTIKRGGKLLAYLTQGVFPFYIMHQTIIVVTEFWLKRLALPQPLEAAILIVATFSGCWLSFEIVRRIAVLRPLFGLRRLPPAGPSPDLADGTPIQRAAA